MFILTQKQLEMYGCIISTLAADALELKHQAISIHCARQVSIVLDQFHMKKIAFMENNTRN